MKTTAAGIWAALALIVGEINDYLDDSKTTAFELDVVVNAALVAWGLFQAANKQPAA